MLERCKINKAGGGHSNDGESLSPSASLPLSSERKMNVGSKQIKKVLDFFSFAYVDYDNEYNDEKIKETWRAAGVDITKKMEGKGCWNQLQEGTTWGSAPGYPHDAGTLLRGDKHVRTPSKTKRRSR